MRVNQFKNIVQILRLEFTVKLVGVPGIARDEKLRK
jgi:hypothetical protein